MAEAQTIARITRLLAEVEHERTALARLHQELNTLAQRWPKEGDPSRADLVVACVDLHGYYTALEAFLERVARAVDEEVPSGGAWHSELLTQMSLEIPGIRPAVLPPDCLADLHELRRFRHFFRNVYVLDPDPLRVNAHVGRVLRIHPPIAQGVDALRTYLDQVRAALLSS
jgi:hypothetical protein